jgi:hypothetical protein
MYRPCLAGENTLKYVLHKLSNFWGESYENYLKMTNIVILSCFVIFWARFSKKYLLKTG